MINFVQRKVRKKKKMSFAGLRENQYGGEGGQSFLAYQLS